MPTAPSLRLQQRGNHSDCNTVQAAREAQCRVGIDTSRQAKQCRCRGGCGAQILWVYKCLSGPRMRGAAQDFRRMCVLYNHCAHLTYTHTYAQALGNMHQAGSTAGGVARLCTTQEANGPAQPHILYHHPHCSTRIAGRVPAAIAVRRCCLCCRCRPAPAQGSRTHRFA